MPQKQVKGKRISLRYPEKKDFEEFINKSKASIKFHKNLVNPPADKKSFYEFVDRNKTDANECFLIRERAKDEIIGCINLSQIFYGGFKNAYLGYYLFSGFTGKGFMTEALNSIIKFAFAELKLHRLEANIQPQNSASINLVKKCGFTKEGFSRKYLKINGKWRDHERWAIIKEDWIKN